MNDDYSLQIDQYDFFKLKNEQSSEESSYQQQNQDSQVKCTVESSSLSTSAYLNEYQKQMPEINLNDFIGLKLDELRKNKIFYNPAFYQNDISVTMIGSSANFTIVNLSIAFSYFMFQVTVFNFREQSYSKILNLPEIGNGSFGKIFFSKFKQKKIAIKSIPYDRKALEKRRTSSSNSNSKTLTNSLNEFCLYKLFSVLQIGPFVENIFGFDVLFFSDRIEFSMEMCEKTSTTSMNQLLLSLRMMHSLKIIHGDIKPSNIMWSPTFKKNVFIDFGLSKIIRENIGQMTLTNFFGTYSYCSKEMRSLFGTNELRFVDLYHNDFYSLKKILDYDQTQTSSIITLESNFENDQEQKTFNNIILNLQILYQTYCHNVNGVREILENNRNIYPCHFLFQTFLRLSHGKITSQIVKFVLENIPFDDQYKKIIQDCYIFNQYFPPAYTQGSSDFQMRIIQTQNQYTGTINQIMLYSMIIYSYDTTPKAYKKCLSLEKKLMNCLKDVNKQLDLQFWNNLVSLTLNPYVNQQIITEVFNEIRIRMKIKDQQQISKHRYPFFTQARQITKACFEKYEINLFEIHLTKQSKILKNILNFRDFEKQIRKYENQFPYLQFLQKFMPFFVQFKESKLDFKETKNIVLIFDKILEEITQEYQIKKIPNVIILIKTTIQIEYEQGNVSEQLIQILSNVFNFSPLNNFIPLIISKEFDIVTNYKSKFLKMCLKPLTFCFFFKPIVNFFVMWNDEMIATLSSSKKNIKSTQIIEIYNKIQNFLNPFQNTKEIYYHFLKCIVQTFQKFQRCLDQNEMMKFTNAVYEKNIEKLDQEHNSSSSYVIYFLKFLIYSRNYLSEQKNEEVIQYVDKICNKFEQIMQKTGQLSNLKLLALYSDTKQKVFYTYTKVSVNHLPKRNQILNEFFTRLRSRPSLNLSRILRDTCTLSIYQSYIIGCCIFNMVPHREIEQFTLQIKKCIEKNLSLMFALKYIGTVGFCYCIENNFDQFFTLAKILMSKTKEAQAKKQKLVLLLCQQEFIQKYFLANQNKIKNWCVPMMKKFTETLKTISKAQKDSNIIFLIQKYLSYNFKQFYEIKSSQQLFTLLKLGSFFYQCCDQLYRRSFKLAMEFWAVRFVRQDKIKVSQRKRKLLQTLCMRNRQYYDEKIEGDFLSKIKEQKILAKFQQIRANRRTPFKSNGQFVLNDGDRELFVNFLQVRINRTAPENIRIKKLENVGMNLQERVIKL